MTLSSLDISGAQYSAYASVDEADLELVVAPARSAAWVAHTGDLKKILLVAATRRLDLLRWRGTRAGGAAQANAFPRAGLYYEDGTSVDSAVIPDALVRATAYMAATIGEDNAASGAGQSASVGAIKSVKAGSARVEFATPTSSQNTADPKPVQDETVFELIARWLESEAGPTGAGVGAAAFGLCEDDSEYDYSRTGGFA